MASETTAIIEYCSMQTLIVVSTSTPVTVFHFMISNYVRCMEDPVERIPTTKTFAFTLFPGCKSPASGAITCILGGNSPGAIALRGIALGAIVRGIVLGGNVMGGNSPGEIS